MDAFERRARQRLSVGDVKQAADLIAREYARRGLRGLGFEWKDGHPSTRPAELLLLQGHEELDATPEQRKNVAVELALVSLMGEGPRTASIMAALGGAMRCPALQAFLASPGCSKRIETYKATNPADLAELYALTMLARASQRGAMDQVSGLRGTLGKEMPGVRILPAGDPCSICGTEMVSYRWDSAVPELPRHWGCRCVYSPWIE